MPGADRDTCPVSYSIVRKSQKGDSERLRRLSEVDRSQVNKELDGDETRFRELSLQEAKSELGMFNEVMNLFFELILFNEKLPSTCVAEDAKDARSAQVILMVDIFNCLRATYKLLLDGYYGQLAPLLRRVNECLLRILFFQAFPHKATLYLKTPRKWQKEYRGEKRLRKELKQIDELSELMGELQKKYSQLSELTHATISAMVTHMYPSPQEGTTYLSVGGTFHPTWLHAYAKSLIMWTMLGLKAAARPYYPALCELDPKWLDRAKELEQAIGALMIPISGDNLQNNRP